MANNKELLEELFNTVLEKMLDQAKTGDLDPRQVANMIKLFKDNGVSIEVKEGKLIDLPEKVPFQGDSTVYRSDIN